MGHTQSLAQNLVNISLDYLLSEDEDEDADIVWSNFYHLFKATLPKDHQIEKEKCRRHPILACFKLSHAME